MQNISVRGLTAVTKGLVPFEDKPFKAYLNKRLSKRRKLDIAHGSLNFIEKTFHPDVLPQLYNVADFGRAMFSIPLKMAIILTLNCWRRRFRRRAS
ncbi:putative enzyme [Klebsiella variicola]|nr:putative enzyme [Klebsiella variicola]